MDTKQKYAWVKGSGKSMRIYHAGFVKGQDGNKVWLVGAGLKGFPYYGLWVPKSEIIPLSEASGIQRHPSSYSGKSSNSRKNPRKKYRVRKNFKRYGFRKKVSRRKKSRKGRR